MRLAAALRSGATSRELERRRLAIAMPPNAKPASASTETAMVGMVRGELPPSPVGTPPTGALPARVASTFRSGVSVVLPSRISSE